MKKYCYFCISGKQFTGNLYYSIYLRKLLLHFHFTSIWANFILSRLDTQNNFCISMPLITEKSKPICEFSDCHWCQLQTAKYFAQLGALLSKPQILPIKKYKIKKKVRFSDKVTIKYIPNRYQIAQA